MEIICPCGQKVEAMSVASCYSVRQFDENGQMVYAVCRHGLIVIDERNLSGE